MDFEDLVLLALGAAGLWWYWTAGAQALLTNQLANGTTPSVPLPGGWTMSPAFLDVWAEAIASFEGFYTPNSRPQRDNNPGDLKYAGQPGATGQDPAGFAVFPDPGTGWAALSRQLAKYVSDFPNYNLGQIMAHYLGQHGDIPTVTAEGNAIAYANSVAARLGVPVTTTLAQLATGTVSAAMGVAGWPGPGMG